MRAMHSATYPVVTFLACLAYGAGGVAYATGGGNCCPTIEGCVTA